MTIAFNRSRTNSALTRALAGKSDIRRAKRFLNRINADIRRDAPTLRRPIGYSYSPTQRNQTQRVLLRMIARAK